MNADRIINAVGNEWCKVRCSHCPGPEDDAPRATLTTAIVNTALLGVCPECLQQSRGVRAVRPGEHDPSRMIHAKRHICDHPYHDYREEMMRHGE